MSAVFATALELRNLLQTHTLIRIAVCFGQGIHDNKQIQPLVVSFSCFQLKVLRIDIQGVLKIGPRNAPRAVSNAFKTLLCGETGPPRKDSGPKAYGMSTISADCRSASAAS